MYDLLLPELVRKIYEYDNTYREYFKQIIGICQYKFENYFVTNNGNTMYIYTNEEIACLSIKSPMQFYKNFYRLKIYSMNNIEYSKNWKMNNTDLGIKVWFDKDATALRNIVFEKAVLKY